LVAEIELGVSIAAARYDTVGQSYSRPKVVYASLPAITLVRAGDPLGAILPVFRKGPQSIASHVGSSPRFRLSVRRGHPEKAGGVAALAIIYIVASG
jgi:hypothetical protein